MTTTTTPKPCACKNCSDPDALAAYEAAVVADAESRVLNRMGFDLFMADREAGREVLTADAYVAKAKAALADAVPV